MKKLECNKSVSFVSCSVDLESGIRTPLLHPSTTSSRTSMRRLSQVYEIDHHNKDRLLKIASSTQLLSNYFDDYLQPVEDPEVTREKQELLNTLDVTRSLTSALNAPLPVGSLNVVGISTKAMDKEPNTSSQMADINKLVKLRLERTQTQMKNDEQLHGIKMTEAQLRVQIAEVDLATAKKRHRSSGAQ